MIKDGEWDTSFGGGLDVNRAKDSTLCLQLAKQEWCLGIRLKW